MEPFNLYTVLPLEEGEEVHALAAAKDALLLGLANGKLLHCAFSHKGHKDHDIPVSFHVSVVPVPAF